MLDSMRRALPALCLLAAVAAAQSEDARTTAAFAGTTTLQRFAVQAAQVADLNGDGRAELAVGDATFQVVPVVGNPTDGRVLVLDGASGAVLRTHPAPVAFGEFGKVVLSFGDLNGDGSPEYGGLLGDAPGCTSAAYYVGYPPNRCSTTAPLGGGSTPGGGPPGGVVIVPPPVQVQIFNGATGALFFTGPAGQFVAPAGDVDGDGIDEIFVGTAAAGFTLIDFNGTSACTACSFASVATFTDLTGDGVDDLLEVEPLDSTIGPSVGRVRVVSGASGTVVATLFGTAANDRFGESAAVVADLDGDGVRDLAISAPGFDDPIAGLADVGRISVVSGATRAALWFADGAAGGELLGSPFARARIVGLGDVDGDGSADLAAPFLNAQSSLFGYRILSGADGRSIATTLMTVPVGSTLHYDIVASTDEDGDGLADIVLRNPNFSVVGSVGEGAIEKRTFGRFLGAAAVSAVDFGAAASYDVLRLNGSAGGPQRRVDLGAGGLLTVGVDALQGPPSTTPFLLFAQIGAPGFADAFGLPFGLGTMVFAPQPLAPTTPGAFFVVDAFSAGGTGALLYVPPAPWSLTVTAPNAAFDVCYQALLLQPNGALRVTNAVLLSVR